MIDSRDYNQFIKPVTAFVTFKYQNGMERCINSFESSSNFLGNPVFANEKEYEFKKGVYEPVLDKNGNVVYKKDAKGKEI